MPHFIVHPAVTLLFPAAMAFAASMDLFTMTIPNRLSLALSAPIVIALVLRVPMAEIAGNFSCAFAVLALGFGMFAMGWIGGGDAKLAAATALWLGWGKLLEYGLDASILGGALTLGILFLRKLPLPEMFSRQAWIARLHDAKTGVPYGLALAAAGMILYPQSQIFVAAVGR